MAVQLQAGITVSKNIYIYLQVKIMYTGWALNKSTLNYQGLFLSSEFSHTGVSDVPGALIPRAVTFVQRIM